MIDFSQFDQRPLLVVIAGPNGAGKTTFFRTHLASAGLPFVNADVVQAEQSTDFYDAANIATDMRMTLVDHGESFVFETVFSDPVGDKLAFFEDARRRGYMVVLCFIGIPNAETSVDRVAMRVIEGGHDVPKEKLLSRFLRTLENLRRAIARLPHVLVYDNSDLAAPYRLVAAFENGQLKELQEPVPDWLRPMLP